MAQQESPAFKQLKDQLREMFQLDRGDLDFGIYRIMNQKRGEVTKFLDEQLLPQVREILEEYQPASASTTQDELNKLLASLNDAGVDPETSPKVKELRAKLGQSVDINKLENEIYSDLYNFFKRYYSEGDFMSMRRYKEGVYALPYEGEEVKLHWANHDQYYIKTSEDLKNYSFKTAGGKKRVRFEIVAGGTETNNNKAAEGKERRFIMHADAPVQANGDELIIRFEYRPDEAKRKQDDLNKETLDKMLNLAEATAVGLKDKAPSEKNADRTLLEKHLTEYTAKNTFDYFIHKDLGKFLRQELDFFIKNEIIHLDDIENETAPKVETYLAKVKAMRKVAGKIIQFLAQLEDLQKKLWLKKKFVLETHYCITLDHIIGSDVADELLPIIAASDAQREEWVKLFAINDIKGYATPLTTDFLKSNDKLLVDTKFFDAAFKYRLLSLFDNLDEQTDGVMINSENFQALNLLQERYREKVKCIYIDPPYNTEQDRATGKFLYKDSYSSSSWVSFIKDRLYLDKYLQAAECSHFISIDDNEISNLIKVVEQQGLDFHGIFTWRRTRTGGHLSSTFNQLSDYVIISTNAAGNPRLYGGQANAEESQPLVKNTNQLKELKFEPDEIHFLDFNDGVIASGDFGTDGKIMVQNDIIVTNGKNSNAVKITAPFIWTQTNLEAELSKGAIIIVKKNKNMNPRCLRNPEGHKPFPSLGDGEFQVGTNEDGSSIIEGMFAANKISSYPKPVKLIERLISAKSFFDNSLLTLDYFAGSGTTGHAVINLNREDGGKRKYALVEMGEYFASVTHPRILKATYSKDWKDGKPVSREGASHILKYMALEQYEDALDNLGLSKSETQAALLASNPTLNEQYMLGYMLDVESRGSQSLLNIDAFADPFAYTLRITRNDDTRLVNVDLIETFNYLLGLTVRTVDRDKSGIVTVTGKNSLGENCLIIWRNVNEIDNAKLDAWFGKRYSSKDFEFDAIYVNGDNNIENMKLADDHWKVRLIEAEFKRLMFDVSDV